ncbi:MAG: hypothetical protein V4549_09965 [Bacteroidota bacterium]
MDMTQEREKVIRQLIEKVKQENNGEYLDFAIPGFLAKGIIGYQSMRADLQLMISACEILSSANLHPTIVASLWHTIIGAYGKCFTDAKSAKHPKLEPSECFAKDNIKFLEAHTEIMELRHNFIAHRGSTDEEIGIGIVRMNIETLQRQIKVKQIKRIKPSSEKLQSYIKLFNFLLIVVETKYEVSANKIAKYLVEAFTAKELAMMRI